MSCGGGGGGSVRRGGRSTGASDAEERERERERERETSMTMIVCEGGTDWGAQEEVPTLSITSGYRQQMDTHAPP
jgi:hypothetical protein